MLDLAPYNDIINCESPVSDHELNFGLVAWWKAFADYKVSGCYGGNIWKDINSNIVGTLNGASANSGFRSIIRPGGYGSWLGDGSAGRVASTYSPQFGANSFSIICWIYCAQVPVTAYVPFATSTTLGGLGVACNVNNAGSFSARISDGTHSGIASATGFGTGQWHQVGVVVNRATQKIIPVMDGVLQTANGNNTTTVTSITNANGITFGALVGGGDYMSGYLDDARIWNRALSATEVQQLYQDDLQGNPLTLNRNSGIKYFNVSQGLAIALQAYATSQSFSDAEVSLKENKNVQAFSPSYSLAEQSIKRNLSPQGLLQTYLRSQETIARAVSSKAVSQSDSFAEQSVKRPLNSKAISQSDGLAEKSIKQNIFSESISQSFADGNYTTQIQTKYQLLSFRRYSSQYIVQSGQVNDGGL